LKTIKDLVAASTGFNGERGDQLIVESLPFESSLNAEPPKEEGPAARPKKEVPGPAWLELLRKNRELLLPVALGLGIVLFLIRAVMTRLRRKPRVEAPLELPESSAAAHPQLEAAPGERMGVDDDIAIGSEDRTIELAGRVRELAQKDLGVAANVVRLWLQESEIRTT
jgi:flagellar M-ring protein FliF